MPLNRYLIRNEYNLADQKVYKVARKEDPEALLEGVTMAGLVGVLRQLGDLADFAAEIFHGLHEEVMTTAARRHDLIVRVQQLEAELPLVEKTLLSQTSHTAAFCSPGVDWHSEVRLDENVVTRRDLPRFVMDSYEDCRGPPQLFLLDKFDVAGAGACLKRFSDPSFFKLEPTDCSYTNSEAQREKKTRKTKRRGPRMRNGDASELIPSSHAQLYQLLSEDTESCGTDAERRVKLKKRPLDGFHRQEKSGQSYMQKFFDVCSPEHKFVHEISLDLVLMDPVSNMTPKSGLEIVETDMTIPYQEPSERNEETYSPSRVPDLVDKRSINKWIEVTNGKHAELSWENQGSHSDKILALLDKDINDEEELDAGSRRKSEGRGGESHSDDMSDSDSFEDALATMESEVETDTESRTKRDLHHPNLSKTTINSDGSDGQEYFNDPFSDFQSFGNSTMSDEGCVVKKGREKFSHSDTKGNIAESVPAQGKEAAGKSSGDLLPEQQSLSLVVGRTKTNDYVPCSTSDVSRVKVQLEEASPKSGKVGDTFAKTEIKWVKRCDEVSSDETVSSSLSSAEDPETCGQYSSPSQTDCTIHYSSPYLCDQINERNGSSDILLEEESLGCASVAEETPVSSHSLENSNYMDSKDDDHVSYLGKKSQGESLQADLGKEQGEAKNKIAGISYVLQLDVSQVPLPCSGDIADSSSVSKAEDEWKMRQTVPFTLGEETLKSRTYPAMDGQDLEENTRFVDQNEAQKPSTETICLLEPICSGETDAAQNLKIDPPEASVTGSDERISGIDCKAQSGLDVKESPNAICVEEARFGLTNETTENHEAHPASCQDRSDFPLCGGRDDKHPDVYVEAIEKDIYLDSSKDGTEEEKDLETPSVSPSKQDGTEEEKDLKTPSVSPSKHIIGSDYVLEEDNYLDMNHTAVGKVCGEVVVTGDLDEGIDDENADGSPLSSHLDHSPPLGPMEQHEEFYVEGSSQNGNKIPDMSPECPVKLEAQNDRSHTEDVPENSSSPLCGTISSSDPVSRVSDNGPSVFLADDVQANLYQRYLTEDKADHMDTSDNHDCTESLVATGEAEVPHAGKCPEEGSQALDLDQPVPSNLSVQFTNIDSESQPLEARFVVPSSSIPFQDQPSVAELLVEMVDHNPVIQHDMEPSTSVSPSGSVLPDQIRVNLNFNVSRLPSDASSGSPVLGVISDTSETKLDEAPPLPPLPPMQWRLGKNQQNASSMLETLGSEQQLATHQTDDYNLVGPQHWNPFASFSNEDSKFTNISTQGKLINHEAAVQDEELQHISPAGQQENTIPIDHIPSLPEEGNVNSSSQPVSPPTMQHGAQLQHGFITPEDQQAWSRSAFHAVDPGSGNGKTQKKPPRPRNPLIEEVVALDKSKLRKVGERVRHQDEPRAEDKQSLPKLRKVGERTKPKDTSEQLEQSLRRLRKVGERVKFSDEASFEGREQNHAQLQEVGERVELQDELPSEERGGQDNLKSEEREQSLPRLQKIGERVNLQGGLSIDNRDSLMEQIKNKTFSLKPTVTTRANIQGPQTNLKIAAILEKATTIRQAMAGSDEDDSDGWSDN